MWFKVLLVNVIVGVFDFVGRIFLGIFSIFYDWFSCNLLNRHDWSFKSGSSFGSVCGEGRVLYDVRLGMAADWRECVNCGCKQVNRLSVDSSYYVYCDLISDVDVVGVEGYVDGLDRSRYRMMSRGEYLKLGGHVRVPFCPKPVAEIPSKIEIVVSSSPSSVHGYRSIDAEQDYVL